MSETILKATPVIIIGAGRSGTNILRDVLTRLDGIRTWPCDEINYIWRHGNRTHNNDEFSRNMATKKISSYIRHQFAQIIASQKLTTENTKNKYIIEKTCANSLRVDFVDKVLPEAKYIFIIRDGRDVVASSSKRWQADLNISYILAKARFVPKSDLIFYARRYLQIRLAKLMSKENSLSVWGPKFSGMDLLSKDSSLEEVCATQWVKCVEAAELSFDKMDDTKVHSIKYEEFVNNPVEIIHKIATFLGTTYTNSDIESACSEVRSESVGKGLIGNVSHQSKPLSIMNETLSRHRYL